MDIDTQHTGTHAVAAGNEDSWEYVASAGHLPNELPRPPRFDIHGWFTDIFSPPPRRPAHSILMDSELWTEEMDAEVDELMNSAAAMALVQKTTLIAREEMLEYVAVKFLKASGQEVREAMEKRRESLYQTDLARWKSELLEAHPRAEDAEEFAADLMPTLTMIADLIAQKCSGVCVFYYTGPDEVYCAEGVCDLPGRVVKSFCHMNRASHLGLASQIKTYSGLINGCKWGNSKDGHPADESASDHEAMIIDETEVLNVGEEGFEGGGMPREKWRIARIGGAMTEIEGSATAYAVVARRYDEICQTSCAVLEKRKEWFALLKMTPYLVAVPKRLHGGVDVDLACRVAQAYLNFEMSNAEEGAITMKTVGDVGQRPEYTSNLIGKRSRVMWRKRAELGEDRNRKLDHDVAEYLPRQWAAQQPSERRRDGEMLTIGAKDTVDWDAHLPAGADGVRVLVVTLLTWGWDIRQNERQSEVVVWESLARDYAEVLDVLTKQAGNFEAPPKLDSGRAAGKRPTEKMKSYAETLKPRDKDGYE
ncbi:unnamed protein product [Peniophora sp. CBMAI 1063]|nr:unnamed protein product [Peniophora sp. CBMAI 1063]